MEYALTLMLLAEFANTKLCKKKHWKIIETLAHGVLIREYTVRAI